jgi:hypothetical protein
MKHHHKRASAGLVPLMEAAAKSLGYREHAAPGIDPEDGVRVAKRAAVSGAISLRTMLPTLINAEGRITRAPAGQDAGDRLTMELAAAGFSRAIDAGAALVVLPTRAPLVAAGQSGAVILADEPARLITIEAGAFSALTLDPETGEDEVSASALPISVATVDRENLPQHAIRFEISRATIKDRGLADIEAEIVTAITLGLGRALDAEIFRSILAEDPPLASIFPFDSTSSAARVGLNAGAAASAGLRWRDLRAVIGTNGTGATVDAGALYVGGVPAETSADMAETILGDWRHAGVFVADEIMVTVDRRSAQGDLTVTAFAGAQGVCANVAKFWKAAAS